MEKPAYHLAQINVARMRASLDDPLMAGFVAQLDAVNAVADRSPGFVWRLQDEAGDATSIRVFDDDHILVNMSVWETMAALQCYVYRGDHVAVLRDRKRWFERMEGPPLALWWIRAGHLPTPEEGRQRLAHLHRHGPTPEAFTFRHPFPSIVKQAG